VKRLLLALLFALPLHAQLQEQIVVERIIVDARVTDSAGEPVLNLEPKDFRVRIDGKDAVIESVEWIPETAAARELASTSEEEDPIHSYPSDTPAPRGRLLVFLFQTDFARNAVRSAGQMKSLIYADELLETLEEDDRVAVFSYDSHLKFRLDFSGSVADIHDACEKSLRIDEPPAPRVVPRPSLAASLNRDDMRNAATPERALTVLANALRPIPGPKSLILFGWGLGQLWNRRVEMGRDYAIARGALESARVSVFSLDFTAADGHTLAAGLATAAHDTGGFYAALHNFPQLAIDRLQKTLTGHYELEVRKPQTKVTGVHTIEVDVPAVRNAVVMARTTYVDK
jgi:VWFA-related protein